MKKIDAVLGVIALMGVMAAAWFAWQWHAEGERTSALQRQVAELQARLDRSVAASPKTPAIPAPASPESAEPVAVASAKVPALTAEETKELQARRDTAELLRQARANTRNT